MQRLQTIVALVAILTLVPSGGAVLAACFDEGPHRCCCDVDCPDDSVSASRTMPCCKPAQTPLTPQDPAAQRPVEAGAAHEPVRGLADALPIDDPAPVALTPAGVRPVPLFRLHAALLI